MTDRERLRERHAPYVSALTETEYCHFDGQDWPCEVAALLSDLAAAEERVTTLQHNYYEADDARAAAEERVRELERVRPLATITGQADIDAALAATEDREGAGREAACPNCGEDTGLQRGGGWAVAGAHGRR